MKKSIRCIFCVLLAVLSCSTIWCCAESIPYDTYTYWVDDAKKTAVPIKTMYEYSSVLNGTALGIGEMSAPTDISSDGSGNIYILDSANARIIVIEPAGTLLRVIQKPTYKGEELDFKDAMGISVNCQGQLLVSDTSNGRVLRLSSEGAVLGIMTLPDSKVIPDDFNFQPTKSVSDSQGYTYVLSNGSYYGALVYNADNEFCGFYGANEVEGTILDFFGKLWRRVTQTEEKLAATQQKIPYQFIDMAVDKNNFIYTLTGQTSAWSVNKGQIRKMNPLGKNVLKTYTGKSASSFSFADESNLRIDKSSQFKETSFEKLCIDESGFIYAVDSNFGHIFIYDSESNPLGIFGGDTGNQLGTFEHAQSIAACGDKLYVLDSARNSVTVFTQTEYGRLYKQAQALTLGGDNKAAEPLWQQILKQDKNNQLAYRGIAAAQLEQGNYSSTMKEAKKGLDRTTYALAFTQIRNQFFVNNTWWIILIVVAVISAGIALAVINRKRQILPSAPGEVGASLLMIRHPFYYSNKVKSHNQGSVKIALIYLILFYVSSCMADIGIGFSFGSVVATDYNTLITLAGTAGIAVLFAISNWAVCVLASGKARFREIFIVTCYSLLPLILNRILQLSLSNVLVPEESAIMTILNIIAYIATGIILCIGISIQQEYNFFKFSGTFILSVVVMGLIIFILFMLGILLQELAEFIRSIIREIFYR